MSSEKTDLSFLNSSVRGKMDFLVYIDGLKNVLRQTKNYSNDRRENSAEHSWHLALFVLILGEGRGLDLFKCIKMALIHDLVEIETGDVIIYDEEVRKQKEAEEAHAAEEIFAKLPEDLGSELHQVWLEFEQNETDEAQFVKLVDRLQPLTSNYVNAGYSWEKHGISAKMVRSKHSGWQDKFEDLCHIKDELIEQSVKRGFLP